MRRLTVSTALIAGCLIAGAAWAQGSSSSSSSSSSGGGGAGGSTSSTAAPSAGSTNSTGGTGTTLRPPVQGVPNSTGRVGNTDVRNTPDTVTGSRPNQDGGTAGNNTTSGPISPPGSEGSTGGTGTSANRSSTDPDTTGGVSGTNRLQPGERSAVGPSQREEELFQKGEQLEQKAREGICSNCGAQD
jgi:hypothetical protein